MTRPSRVRLGPCAEVLHTETIKTIALSEDPYAALAALKREGQSFSDVAGAGPSLSSPAHGKDVPEEKMRRYLTFLADVDDESKAKFARELRRPPKKRPA